MSYVLGNLVKQSVISVALAPVAVAQATTAEQDFTVNGLQVGDHVLVNKPTAQTGIGIVGSRVSAANTLSITYCNVPSGGNITPTTETYQILLSRKDSTITDANI